MTAPVRMAHLCGPLRQALAVVGGETWLYESEGRRRPTSNDINFFFSHGLEVRALDPARDGALSEERMLSSLDLEARRFDVLQGLLMGMDPELDDALSCKGMRRAERLLADSAVADFIERRFLKPVVLQEWDLSRARRLARAENLSKVERLYAIVDEDVLLRLEDEIATWAANHSSVERRIEIEKAYESGLISTLAIGLYDGDPDKVRTKIFWAKSVAWDRHLAAHLIARFASHSVPEHAPAELRTNDDETIEPAADDVATRTKLRIAQSIEEFRARERRRGHRHRGDLVGVEAFGAYQAALKQVEWIAARFEKGQIDAAWADVADLAQQQLADGDPNKLAMSLTSLATRLSPHDVAFLLYDLAALSAPDDPTVWTAQAELLRDRGRVREALAAYDRAVDDFPQDVFAQCGRAETLRALGRLDEALVAYDRTVKDFPQNVVARSGRAETLRALGRLDEALAAYDRTVEDFPQNAVVRNGRAETLRALGRLDEALAAYDRTVEDFPRNAVARNGRAETLRALGRLEEALAAYDRAVEEFPQEVVARNGHAETLRTLGQLDEALVAYDRTVKAFPQDAVARNGYAVCLGEAGRLNDARRILNSIVSAPRTLEDWVGLHILCMIDLRAGANAALVQRLEQFAAQCRYPAQQLYFQTTLAVTRIALKQMPAARRTLTSLLTRPALEAGDRVALRLMEAHVEAAEGHLDAARRVIAEISNVVSYEQFRDLRQLRQQVERRFGLGSAPPLTRLEDIVAADKKLVQSEMDFWVERSRRRAA